MSEQATPVRDEHESNPEARGHDHDHRDLESDSFWWRRETLITGWAGLVYFLGLVVHFVGSPLPVGLVPWLGLSEWLFLVTFLVAGSVTIREGLAALVRRELTIDFLITLAMLGALALGKYLEAASLSFLYGVAELLEDYSMIRARGSLAELLELSPDTAVVRRNDREREVNVEDLQVGDTVLVRPGSKIAVDGTVLEGTSQVNESPVTGESMPTGKEPGDRVFAGTYNEEGYLEVRVDQPTEQNTLNRIIKLVREAEASRAPAQRFVDRFSSYYTPAVVLLAVITGLVVPFLPGVPGSFSTWWLRAMALLVIACPCGLLISTPVTVVSGLTSAARHGTLIRGGEPFENLGQLSVICFDKTGTLTRGEPTVSDLVSLNGSSEDELLRIAASLESRSEHHLARAIQDCARARDLELESPEDFETITASGVSATLDGHRYWVGKPELFDVEEPEVFRRLEEQGKTSVCVGTRDRMIGVIGIADRVRPEARSAVQSLQKQGLRIVMMTGDNQTTARQVAEELGIDRVFAGLLPEQKVDRVRELAETEGGVAMVGDGINDAPALAAADVGIAMGAAGSDTALETADIALMGDNLNRLSYVVALSRLGESVIKQNIVGSIAVKLILAVGIIPGWVNLITAVLVGDMGVTFAITANALRLRGLRDTADTTGGTSTTQEVSRAHA